MIEQVAFIGARGGHYHYALRALEHMPAVRVVALADGAADCPVAPVAKWCAEHGQSPRMFTDWRQMLDDAKPQAVVISGPFELHAEMSIAAIERGMHVFVEKPAALTLEDLDRLAAAHRARPSVQLVSMMGKRYDPGIFTAARLVRDGAIGDVRLINTRKSYKLGKRDAFYKDRSTYGGTIPWVGAHAIDWILWIGAQPITSVSAAHAIDPTVGLGTMERTAVCHFTLAGGRFATASIDFHRPPNSPTHGDDWIRIVGSAGVLEARPHSISMINATNDGTLNVAVSCDRQIFRDFLDAIAGKRPPMIDAAQTIALTRACLLARQSADEHRTLPCDPIGYDRPE